MSEPRLKRLVIATHNRKKAGEMVQILSARFPALDLRTLADYANAPEPAETGATYSENASIKAESAAMFTGEYALADDAGLEIDALDGGPGLLSKRFAGEETPFPEKIARVLDLMRDVPQDRRNARFRCCVALSTTTQTTDHKPQTTSLFEATCEGRIAFEPSGAGGFGYDPIFYLPELACTMADLTAEQKHSISHRGKVLRILGDYLASSFEL